MSDQQPHRLTLDDVEAQLTTRRQRRRSDIGRMGASALHATHDAQATTRGAFQARMRRYELQIDPDGALARRDPQALARRVESALAADMAKVRLARAAKKAKRAAAAAQAARTAELERAAIAEQIRRCPPDDMARLAALLLALQALETASHSPTPQAETAKRPTTQSRGDRQP